MKKLFYLLLLLLLLSLGALPTVSARAVTGDSGYGATIITGKGFFTQTAANDFKDVGLKWVRGTINWTKIETSPGVYDWSMLDAAVNLANANGLFYDFPIMNPPSWDTDPNACNLPSASAEANFGKLLVERYGTRIASYEVGNEEWSLASAGSCRDIMSYYVPVLEQSYTAMKAANPAVIVGMYGPTEYTSMVQLHSIYYGLFSDPSDPGKYMDYINVHYYPLGDPDKVDPNGVPKFTDVIGEIHADALAFGHGGKPIEVTEFGWCINTTCNRPKGIVTQQQQSDYIMKVISEAQASGFVSHAFVYTIAQGTDGMSITQSNVPTIAYNTLKSYIPTHSWT